jgi:hypothetical protein
MKTILTILIFATIIFCGRVAAQTAETSKKLYLVIKHDGTEFSGKLISRDAHEVMIETSNMSQVAIPTHEIATIREVEETEVSDNGDFRHPDPFSTRYSLTTNAMPLNKDKYVLWNLYGPEFQFGISKNLSVGVMTTWLATPIIASIKCSVSLAPEVHLGAGTLLGHGSWALPSLMFAVPYGVLTFGNRSYNLSCSAGYGYVTMNSFGGGRALGSLAAMVKLGKKTSFIFDSYMVFGESGDVLNQIPSILVVIPALRLELSHYRAFQFGFTGINAGGQWLPIPIPTLKWFRKF